jgi:queuine tRNA-ribosyltransferase
LNWDKPILTDSGGYQVFSLQDLRKIKEDGVVVDLNRILDGSKHWFSLKKLWKLQQTIGSIF